ncbi:PREDICTED: uncharacterized protein LOC104707651 isoform X1 [Camelina sativa]|uniref:Uncharacterized protein LOC104707651 isoform X1 n=1 Tax=Camelina sativa TaxID=90675 RepID=A0ABM0T876_CAMSA|nr:PREDICTED: uncharacterized protein LOC104707651 isoform X1 [Camelina sativa]
MDFATVDSADFCVGGQIQSESKRSRASIARRLGDFLLRRLGLVFPRLGKWSDPDIYPGFSNGICVRIRIRISDPFQMFDPHPGRYKSSDSCHYFIRRWRKNHLFSLSSIFRDSNQEEDLHGREGLKKKFRGEKKRFTEEQT